MIANLAGRNQFQLRFRPRSALAWLAALLFPVILVVGVPTNASATDTSGCSVYTHCYAVLRSTDSATYGAYGNWYRAPLTSGNYTGEYRLITSEMWAATASGSAWVETGHTAGHFLNASDGAETWVGYRAFYARYSTSGVYAEQSMGTLTPNTDVTDEFQISRSGTTNRWNVYFNGAVWTTADVGFWSAPRIDVGGEAGTSQGNSGLFVMNARAINSAGQRVLLATETTSVNDPPLRGTRIADSTWRWRVPE